jgi:hypothetical protein
MGIIPNHVIPNWYYTNSHYTNSHYTNSRYTKSRYTKSRYTKSRYTKQGGATFYICQKTGQIKQSSFGQKFSQSGHPGCSQTLPKQSPHKSWQLDKASVAFCFMPGAG